ncbi:hypothetical protein JCM11641_006167 [Rhodosporidiobolus odoratus]
MLSRVLGLAALAAAAHAALVVKDGKLTVIDHATASAVHSTSFTSSSPSTLAASGHPYALSETDSLKLAFTLKDDSTNKGFQPQQAALGWQPLDHSEREQYGRDAMMWVKVNRKSGKGKWELDLSRAPASLLSLSSGPLSLTLLLAAPNQSPLSLPLGVFTLPASLALPYPFPPNEDLPRSWQVEKYDKQPELGWTFREAEKRVGVVKAAGGTAVVLAPWVVFAGVLSPVLPTLPFQRPSPTTTLFLTLLLTLESSYILYWLSPLPLFNFSPNLIQFLPWFGGLALASAAVGRKALGQGQRRRIQREGMAKKSQ